MNCKSPYKDVVACSYQCSSPEGEGEFEEVIYIFNNNPNQSELVIEHTVYNIRSILPTMLIEPYKK